MTGESPQGFEATPEAGSEIARRIWGEHMSESYVPAYRLGNERDARIIHEKSGKKIEDFLSSATGEEVLPDQDEA